MAGMRCIWTYAACILNLVAFPVNSQCEDFAWNKPTGFIGFSVALTKDYLAPNTASEYVIPYDHTFTNDLQLYDLATQTFTAPVAGVYAFYLTANGYLNNDIHAKVYAAGKPIISGMEIGSSGRLPVTIQAMVKLGAGDTVNATIAANNRLAHADDTPSTYFSGRLVRRIDA